MRGETARRIRVLYAEDDPSDADLLSAHVAYEPDLDLTVVSTGAECLAQVAAGGYDVLLLDNHLPDMDARDVLQTLGSHASGPPVVVTTSVGDETLVVQLLRLGAADYVPKDGDYISRLPAVLRTAAAAQPGGRAPAEERRVRRRVLYVEHMAADVDLTLTCLADAAPHLQVDTASSAGEALARLGSEAFDLVLADLRLPDLDAVELLREATRRGVEVPFIIVTGGGDGAAAVAALKVGAYDYIVKRDAYIARLPHAIDQAIARHQLARANQELERELAEREHLQQTTAHALSLLDGLQQHAPIGIAFMDPDGRFQRVNEEFAATTALPAAAHIGQTIADVLPALAPHLQGPFREALGGVPLSKLEISGTIAARPAEERHLHVSLYPIRGRALDVVGVGLAMADITERRRGEAALREQAELMSDVARQKDEFLAMLGHELRNPLAPILTALELLRRAGGSDSVTAHAQDVISRQVMHMVRLLDDLLDVARITRGRITLSRQPVEISRIVADAVDSVQPLVSARRHTLEVALPAESILIDGDVTRLVQVIVNLLNNAAKYTAEAGTIRLSVTSESGEVVVRVSDTGSGIPARLLPKIFDLFTQDERALDRAQGGLGLGLTLVKHITELHGGRVEAESQGRGRGSTFTVRLPMCRLQDRGDRDAMTERTAPAALRCLVVEDNVDAARMLEIALTLEGHEVRLAFDGCDAVEAAAAFRPDAVVLDIGLPRMNGYDAARAIRRLPGLAGVVIVAVTGYAQPTDYAQTREAGFDAHLAKPIEIDALLEALSVGHHQAVS